MTPTMEELNRTLKMMNDAASSGGDFILEEVPLIVRELVAWQLGSSILWGAVALVLLFILFNKAFPWWMAWQKEECWSDEKIFSLFFGIIPVAIFSAALLVCNLESGLKAFLAPRLVVIEYVSSMVTK